MSKSSLRTKGRTGTELAIELDRVIDDLTSDSPTMSADKANSITNAANATVRLQLGYIEHARARGDKPRVAFFLDQQG